MAGFVDELAVGRRPVEDPEDVEHRPFDLPLEHPLQAEPGIESAVDGLDGDAGRVGDCATVVPVQPESLNNVIAAATTSARVSAACCSGAVVPGVVPEAAVVPGDMWGESSPC